MYRKSSAEYRNLFKACIKMLGIIARYSTNIIGLANTAKYF